MKRKRVKYEMNEEHCGHVADLSDTDTTLATKCQQWRHDEQRHQWRHRWRLSTEFTRNRRV